MEKIEKFKKSFAESLQHGLPGDQAHVKMLPNGRKLLTFEEKSLLNYQKSAVAIVCYSANNQFYSILTQRHTYTGKHSGQVSFPGGKYETGDINLEFTARRECFEEIGIPMHDGVTLGKLSDVYIPVSEFVVSPFVIFHNSEPLTIKNEFEVDEIITFQLDELLAENSFILQDIELSDGTKYNKTPHFCLSQKMVWGATALILSEFREILKRFL
jgi:8-oxo-dGTP pyrophosphatase MutT (NUDIX family)